MASFDLLKESFNWRKGGSFRWITPRQKRMTWNSNLEFKQITNDSITNNWIYEKILVYDHTWAPPHLSFIHISSIYIHLLPPNNEKQQENLRLFPRWHACHQCHSKVGSGPTFAAARWILWRSQGSTSWWLDGKRSGDSSAGFRALLKKGRVFGYLILGWYDLIGKVQKLKKHVVKFNNFKL